MFHNKHIERMNEDQLADFRRQYVGFVFQSYHLLSTLTALENVTLPLIFKGVSVKERNEQAMEMLEAVGLADRANHKPFEMSGGQQQRLCIARALAVQPEVLLMDEPTSALDEANRDLLLELLRKYQRTAAILFISHDTEAMKALCPITHVMERGKIIETQATEQLFIHPQQPWTKRFAEAACHREEVNWKWTALN